MTRRPLHLPVAGCFCALACAAAARADFPPAADLPAIAQLPDPLIRLDSKRVASAAEWRKERRPELVALFEHYMYGHAPPSPVILEARAERVDAAYFGGKATKKEVTVRCGEGPLCTLQLLVIVPNRREGPVPAFLGMNFCGNHAVVNDPGVALVSGWVYSSCAGVKANHATDEGRGSQAKDWAVEKTIDRGYAFATFCSSDIAPDAADQLGIRAKLLGPGENAPGPHDWGTIAAWAWGFQRAVDYLVTDPAIDKARIAVVGHSRNGKTALLAAALDERIALAIPLQAGCGGTAPSRGKVGESVKQINTAFPHWFAGEFKSFNDAPERLPFDQNGLAALMAPRPVLFSNAEADTWANPAGQFEVLKAADPVYRLLGVEGLREGAAPEMGKLIDSKLGYYIRPGGHSMTEGDWAVFLDFADRHLRGAK